MNVSSSIHQQDSNHQLGKGPTTIYKEGCVLTSFLRIANSISGKNYTLDEANAKANSMKLFTGKDSDELSYEAGAKLISALTGLNIESGIYEGTEAELKEKIKQMDENPYEGFWVTGRIEAHNSDGTKKYGHQVNINGKGDTTQPIVDTSSKDRKDTEGDANGKEPLYRVYWFKIDNSKD